MKELRLLDTGHLSAAANMALELVEALHIPLNPDSTARYDLGEGTAAYRGNVDNKTHLNLNLIAENVRQVHAYST